jgi:hypothetical protein
LHGAYRQGFAPGTETTGRRISSEFRLSLRAFRNGRDDHACSPVALDAEFSNGHNVSAPDMFRMTARGGPIHSDLRHAAIIENF